MSEFKEGSALARLDDSLRATNVLSDDYRKNIMGYALAAVAEAHEQGKADQEVHEADRRTAQQREAIAAHRRSEAESGLLQSERNALAYALDDDRQTQERQLLENCERITNALAGGHTASMDLHRLAAYALAVRRGGGVMWRGYL